MTLQEAQACDFLLHAISPIGMCAVLWNVTGMIEYDSYLQCRLSVVGTAPFL